MRQHHRASEKVFIDHCGPTVEVMDRRTGEIRQVQIFVAVMGASSDTYAEATWTLGLKDWIGSNGRMLAFFGGVTELLVIDYVPGHVINGADGRHATKKIESPAVATQPGLDTLIGHELGVHEPLDHNGLTSTQGRRKLTNLCHPSNAGGRSCFCYMAFQILPPSFQAEQQ